MARRNGGPGASKSNAERRPPTTETSGPDRSPGSAAAAGLQVALAIAEARRFHQPGSYRAALGDISPAALDALIVELRDHDAQGNYPLRVELGEHAGDDWLIARFGTVSRGASAHGPALEADVQVTTDRVHCSELRGDALWDAECHVALRNHLPVIIAALEELLAIRVRDG